MKYHRIGHSPTVRGEGGVILATFFTEERNRLAAQYMLIPEAIELLRVVVVALRSYGHKGDAELIRQFLKKWDGAE